jgi:phospholipid/cholesterol/gamma-HCH transport system permease protein
MRITEQIDALQTFGTDPIKKLVTPRVLAAVIMLPVLTVLMDLVGILGGLIVATGGAGLAPDVYMRGLWQSLAIDGFFLFMPTDFVSGLLKPVVFGIVIAVTSCYYGLNATGGAEAVGVATTRSVVVSSVLVFVLDYFLTQTTLVLLGS